VRQPFSRFCCYPSRASTCRHGPPVTTGARCYSSYPPRILRFPVDLLSFRKPSTRRVCVETRSGKLCGAPPLPLEARCERHVDERGRHGAKQLIGIYRFALFFSRSLPLLIMKQQSAAPQLASCR
jgi:hypothetical protein